MYQITLILFVAFFSCLALVEDTGPCYASETNAVELWASEQVQSGNAIDFNQHCGSAIPQESSLDSFCRRITSTVLKNLIVGKAGTKNSNVLVIIGAKIEGDLNLDNMEIKGPIQIKGSYFDGGLSWNRAHFTDYFLLLGCDIRGTIQGDNSKIDGDLFISDKSNIHGAVSLRYANISGLFDISQSYFSGEVNIDDTYIRAMNAEYSTFYKYFSMFGLKSTSYVDLGGINAVGDLRAQNLDIGQDFYLNAVDDLQAVVGSVSLRDSRVRGSLILLGTKFGESADLNNIIVDRFAKLTSLPKFETTFKGLYLSNASIGYDLDMNGATVLGELDASTLRVLGSVILGNDGTRRAKLNNVNLTNSSITQDLLLGDSEFYVFTAQLLRVGGSFSANGSFRNLLMKSSVIDKSIDIQGINVTDKFALDGSRVSGTVTLSDVSSSSFQDVSMIGTKIGGTFSLANATLYGKMTANALVVELGTFITGTKINQGLELKFAHLKLILSVANPDIKGCNLANTNIDGQFALAYPPSVWKDSLGSYTLDLRNTHVKALADAKDAWPERGKLLLDGFTFERLGGDFGDSAQQMHDRGTLWWNDWIEKDNNFDPAQYLQISNQFSALGDREASLQMRFMERVKERENAYVMGRWGEYILDTVLQLFAGYGIGLYAFRAFASLVILAAVFTPLLWYFAAAVRTKERGLLWAFGACLARLVPVIEINKEFSEYFNDPKRERLNSCMAITFTFLNLIGWLIGAALLIAFSSLAQK